MRSIARVIVRWNLVVTAVSVALTFAGSRLAGCRVDPSLLALVACGTFLVYAVDRRTTFSPEDLAHREQIPPLPAAALAAPFAVLLVLTLRQHAAGMLTILGLGVLSALYILPLLPDRRRLKEIPFVKVLAVAAGWAVATTVLPAVQCGATPSLEVGALTAYRTLFLLPNLLLADWPDRASDRNAGIRTVANYLRPGRFLLMCRSACLATMAAMSMLWLFGLLPGRTAWEWVTPTAFLIILSRPLPSSRLFYAVFADALLAWPAIPAMFPE